MKALLERLQIKDVNPGACTGHEGWITDADGETLVSRNPSTGETIARVVQATDATYDAVVGRAVESFQSWRMVPAPKRGLVIRDLADELREHQEALGERGHPL